MCQATLHRHDAEHMQQIAEMQSFHQRQLHDLAISSDNERGRMMTELSVLQAEMRFNAQLLETANFNLGKVNALFQLT